MIFYLWIRGSVEMDIDFFLSTPSPLAPLPLEEGKPERSDGGVRVR
jgi:hypothetical protein